MKRKYFNRR